MSLPTEQKRRKIYYIFIKSPIITFINNNRLSSSMSVPTVSKRGVSMQTTEMDMVTIPIFDQKAREQFEKKAIRRLIRKLDLRIVPFIFVLEMGAYINRVSIGRYF
jgi:hypothetical protein